MNNIPDEERISYVGATAPLLASIIRLHVANGGIAAKKEQISRGANSKAE